MDQCLKILDIFSRLPASKLMFNTTHYAIIVYTAGQ